MEEAVIVATGRTPIGRARKGSLVNCRPDDLLAHVTKAVLAKLPQLDPGQIEDFIVGWGVPGGAPGFNIARIAGLLAGLNVPGTSVNRFCSSSLQTIRMAAHAIRAGEGDIFLTGGVESISHSTYGTQGHVPHHHPAFDGAHKRSLERAAGTLGPWAPSEGLPDIFISMGQTAENVADIENLSRLEMDEFALRSQQRAIEAQENGFFAEEIVPVTLEDGTVVAKDDGPRPGTTLEVLAGLKTAFREDGRVTAGNSCPLNDGAAAVVVMSERRAAELNIEPMARIVSSGVSALNPEIMGLGPIEASRQALARAHLSIDDIDLVEINEAFAAQVIPSARHLGIPLEKLNIHGGAIALGHPFGMTGARIMTTLLHSLESEGLRFGLETMCIGGGQGMAMIVERL